MKRYARYQVYVVVYGALLFLHVSRFDIFYTRNITRGWFTTPSSVLPLAYGFPSDKHVAPPSAYRFVVSNYTVFTTLLCLLNITI